MKVAYVVPRYGLDVHGGAETGARRFAEQLVALFGWDVSVFTTCAVDSRTWANEYPPGTTELEGVTVHRFRSVAERAAGFDQLSDRLLADPSSVSAADEGRWIEEQGPLCPELVDAVAASDADLLAFYPYLYYPTVHGLPRVAERAVMHPAAHDEPPIHFPMFRRVFGETRGFAFHTHSERRLVEGLFPIGARPQVVTGLGVDQAEGDPSLARARLGVGEAPYLLCVGRVDPGKGSEVLARYFASFKERHPGPLRLVFAGRVVVPPPEHPDIVVTGPIDESTKWGALAGAVALVSPSAFESFSIVVMEAWSVGVPVIVNARCPPTREHAELSGGGLWFGGYGEFEVAVERLTGDAVLRAGLAARGRRYVESGFRWPAILSRYRTFLERVRGAA